MTEWAKLSNEFAEITAKAAQFTVAVHTETRGSSSGVFWRNGIVVTVDHALHRDEEIQLTLPDGTIADAKLIGRDPSSDLAVLKTDATAGTLPSFGDTTNLAPGHITLVVGRTRASGPVAAFGIVSLAASERRVWGGGSLCPYVRLDVALQRTAVGGVVVSADGKAVGMATPKFAVTGALALPVATIDRAIDQLLQNGRIAKGYLGLGLQPVRLPENLRETLRRKEKTAAMVLEVGPEGPAQSAGVLIGDILVELNGQPVTRLEDVQAHLQAEDVGKSLRARFLRGGEPREVLLVVGERPNGGD